MSYPTIFGSPYFRDFAEAVDQAIYANEPVAKPVKDGTGSATAIMQYTFHRDHYKKQVEDGKASWRDLVRVQANEVFSYKDPADIQKALVQLAATCANWHIAIGRRSSDG